MGQRHTALFWNVFGGKKSAAVLSWLREHPATITNLSEVFHAPAQETITVRGGGDAQLYDKIAAQTQGEGKFTICDRGIDYDSIAIREGEKEGAYQGHPELLYGLAQFFPKNTIDRHVEHALIENHDIEPTWTGAWMLQVAELRLNNRLCTVANVRGVWERTGKGDTPLRIRQSERLLAALAEHPRPLILGGDLNLHSTTKSIQMLREAGLRDLVQEYGITSTRSPIYTGATPWADYCFVSPEVNVHRFGTEEITDASDHLPLTLEFSL